MSSLSTLIGNVKGTLLTQESLARYTSWRTGGPADYLYLPADLTDLAQFLKQLPADIPLTWLGLGSNTLVRDGGLEGVVIITQGALMQIAAPKTNTLRAEAGVACAQLARHSARLGLSGLEFMAGIPGTVGGALKMNAGCFGGETWRFVEAVETIDPAGNVKLRSPEDFEISYRHVAGLGNEWFVAGHFALSKGDKAASLETIRQFLEKRNQTQPTGTANCGSVFRNPPGHYAGQLIESCGLKGKQMGGALISEKHANFIINHQACSARDIENLIANIQATVYEQSGIRLNLEVCIIGRT